MQLELKILTPHILQHESDMEDNATIMFNTIEADVEYNHVCN